MSAALHPTPAVLRADIRRALAAPQRPTPRNPLHTYRDALLSMVSAPDLPNLTQRQMAVLLVVYTTDRPQTVRGLARTLNVVPPSISRSLDTLEAHGLARRLPDPVDGRSINVGRTSAGDAFLAAVRGMWMRAATGEAV